MSEVAEIAAEAVEESIDGVVESIEVIRTNPALVVVAGALGVVAGGVGGYFLAKKQLKSFYEDLATQEIEEARVFYRGLNKVNDDGEVLSPMEVLETCDPAEAARLIREYRGEEVEANTIAPNSIEAAKLAQGTPYDDQVDEEIMTRLEKKALQDSAEGFNVFKDSSFDLEEEKKHRSSKKPYVITHDEYFQAELEYENISLTYYEEDDTLVNENDTPISDVDVHIGDESIVRFGHGSKDPNIVYVRNDRLQTDFEVVRSTGSYLVEVLGLTKEEPNSLKHSDNRRREFRRGLG